MINALLFQRTLQRILGHNIRFVKSVLNLNAIVILSFFSFYWSFWIFHKPFLLAPVLVAISVRLLASLFIYQDYSASWSRASSRAFLIKTLLNFIAFFIYMPIFYGEVRVALFISELFIFLFLINFLMYTYQYLARSYATRLNTDIKKKTLVIFGAGQAGVKVAHEFTTTSYHLRVFVDDDKNLQARSIDGTSILSRGKFLKKFKHKKSDLLIIATPSASHLAIQNIYRIIENYASEVKILPSLRRMLLDTPYTEQLKDINIEDLLARHPIDLDETLISKFVFGKTILITGAGGTIGSELARQCVRFKAEHIILLDHSEFSLYQIEQKLVSVRVSAILASVTDREELENIFKKYHINIVIHAAAYKHVPMVEANIKQSIINNVLGTKYVIDAAISNQVEKLVLISSDKAVRPSNVMGATKRIGELYLQNVTSNKTQMVAVRFGNVLGSSGSVIPLFEKQIKAGGPVTVTHPEVTRYFMLISEACELVLQAAALGTGGEIFILDMGEPVKILSLAKQMIKLSHSNDIMIEFIGLRMGEKLREELLLNECEKQTPYPSIMIAKKDFYDIKALEHDISTLMTSFDKIAILKKIVPEFSTDRYLI